MFAKLKDEIGDLYPYDPSAVAAIIFAALYTIACLATTIQFIWHRCWFWVFMVTASYSKSPYSLNRPDR
jgi:hypothetical protein